jgi:hypothetical protein
MACGVSTAAWCHEGQINAIWNNYNNLVTSIPSSKAWQWEWVPLCITMGRLTTTPL